MNTTFRLPFLLFLGLIACGGATVMAKGEVQPLEVVEMESDPLSELAALGEMFSDASPDGGGSIRAKQAANTDQSRRLKDKRNITAKVEAVKAGRFPTVALKVKVTRAAKEGEGKAIPKNTVLVVVPDFNIRGGEVDLRDPQTARNAGAWYLNRGDKVMIRLGKQVGQVWHAQYIERR